MKNLYILSIIYAIGLLVFLLTGLCELNWLFYVAIVVGIVGLGYTIYRQSKIKGK